MRKKKSGKNIDSQNFVEKAIIAVNKQEYKRRNMLMPVELTELEFNVLLGLVEGRSVYEIQIGIKLSNQKDSYDTVVKRLKIKLDAFTLPHAVYKAIKLGLV